MADHNMKSERGTLVFLLFKPIPYSLRIILSLALIIGGLVIQYYSFNILPGAILVLAGNLLTLVKGFDNRLKFGKYNPYEKWERVSPEQVRNIIELHRKMKIWDKSLLDITNGAGFFVFLLVFLFAVILGVAGIINYNKVFIILAINILLLIIPHWFTGVRKIFTIPILVQKINILTELVSSFSKQLNSFQLEYLVYLKGENETAKVIPQDIKIKVLPEKEKEGFLGMYAQISMNDVNGAPYPYFYIVLVAKKGFGLHSLSEQYSPPKNIIKEFKLQKDVEVFVVRQYTTKTTGYHTKAKAIQAIFTEGLNLVSRFSNS